MIDASQITSEAALSVWLERKLNSYRFRGLLPLVAWSSTYGTFLYLNRWSEENLAFVSFPILFWFLLASLGKRSVEIGAVRELRRGFIEAFSLSAILGRDMIALTIFALITPIAYAYLYISDTPTIIGLSFLGFHISYLLLCFLSRLTHLVIAITITIAVIYMSLFFPYETWVLDVVPGSRMGFRDNGFINFISFSISTVSASIFLSRASRLKEVILSYLLRQHELQAAATTHHPVPPPPPQEASLGLYMPGSSSKH